MTQDRYHDLQHIFKCTETTPSHEYLSWAIRNTVGFEIRRKIVTNFFNIEAEYSHHCLLPPYLLHNHTRGELPQQLNAEVSRQILNFPFDHRYSSTPMHIISNFPIFSSRFMCIEVPSYSERKKSEPHVFFLILLTLSAVAPLTITTLFVPSISSVFSLRMCVTCSFFTPLLCLYSHLAHFFQSHFCLLPPLYHQNNKTSYA